MLTKQYYKIVSKYNSIAWKAVKEDFDDVIEQDFNPDIVQLFGIDCFSKGFKIGALSSAALLIPVAAVIAKRTKQ